MSEWPDYLMIRDTKLNDDAGGLGQRIFTTAGAGYVKQKYVREDLASPPPGPALQAINLLVAAGYVSQEKANEAMCIAAGFVKGPMPPPPQTAST